MKVQFAEVRKIPLASLCAFYKIETRKRNNTELVAECPFPSHTSKKHSFTLCISIELNRWYCHSDTCRQASNKPKGGDVIDFVAMMENLTPLDAAKKLFEYFPSGREASGAKESPSAAESASESNKPLAFELKGIDPDHPFIRGRGISLETAMAFGVGFFPGKGSMANRICFPLHENGALIGYAGRTIGEVTPDNPKWKFPAGLIKSFLYGLARCDASKPLILSESPWACLWFHQKGHQAAAMLGSSLTESQERLLAPFRTIHLAMDNDPAGREAAQKIALRLRANHLVYKAFLTE